MARKKKGWVCPHCEQIATTYKKGKKKLIYCHQCDKILAHNPRPIAKIVGKRLIKGALGEIPGASLVMEGIGLGADLLKKTPKETTPQCSNRSTTFEKALALEVINKR